MPILLGSRQWRSKYTSLLPFCPNSIRAHFFCF
jgi:hypothetical protein